MSQGARVLITGVSGFIGSHLVEKMANSNYDLYALERYVTGRYVLGSSRDIKTLYGDLREYALVRKTIREVQPDYVIHIAAISPVSYSYDHPFEVIDTNFYGTLNLAEACLHECPELKQFLFASTSETYGNGPLPRKEDTPQNPNSPYAVAKMAAEKYLLYLRDAYRFPVTILRNFNTYGRKDNTHFVVERMTVQMLRGDEVRLGDPEPVRDLMYVDDHVQSYLTCLGNQRAVGEIFNFCTGIGVKIKGLAEKIAEKTGFKGRIVWGTVPQRPLDIKELVGDNSKAKTVLNWSPKYTLDQGLDLTVKYWRERTKASSPSTR